MKLFVHALLFLFTFTAYSAELERKKTAENEMENSCKMLQKTLQENLPNPIAGLTYQYLASKKLVQQKQWCANVGEIYSLIIESNNHTIPAIAAYDKLYDLSGQYIGKTQEGTIIGTVECPQGDLLCLENLDYMLKQTISIVNPKELLKSNQNIPIPLFSRRFPSDGSLSSPIYGRKQDDDLLLYFQSHNGLLCTLSMKTGARKNLLNQDAAPSCFGVCKHGAIAQSRDCNDALLDHTSTTLSKTLVFDNATSNPTLTIEHPCPLSDPTKISVVETSNSCLVAIPEKESLLLVDAHNSGNSYVFDQTEGFEVTNHAIKNCGGETLVVSIGQAKNAHHKIQSSIQIFSLDTREQLCSKLYNGKIQHVTIPAKDTIVTSGQGQGDRPTITIWKLEDQLDPEKQDSSTEKSH